MNKERKKNLRIFSKMLIKFKGQHIVAMIFSLLNSVLLLLQPILLMKIIDDGVSNLDIPSLLKYLILFFTIIFFQSVCQYITTYIYSYIGKKFIFELRIKLLQHIEKMSGAFFVNTNSSELFTVFDDDIDNIEQLASNMLFSMMSDALIAIVIGIYLAWLQPELFIVILLIQPFVFVIQKKINKKSNYLAFALRDILGEIVKQVQEYLSSITQFIKMNAKPAFWKYYEKSGSEYTKKCRQLDMTYGKSIVLGSLLSGGVVCAIFGYGGYKVILGELTIGGLITFNQYSQKLFQPIIKIAQNSTQLKKILISVDKVFKLLRTETTIFPIQPVFNQYVKQGNIQFEDVVFSYNVKENVFNKLNIHFKTNMCTGIVGKSGEGKTTLINLITRLWDVQSGIIKIDGTNIKNYDLDKLRGSMSIVSQEIFLLNDTIKNNITMLDSNISMLEIENIAKKVGLHNFITNSLDGFETVVGDNGIKLSGGQKQRIAIARVLLKNTPIVIFDEATASLDNGAQEDIIDLIFSLLKNKTVIIIAHRLKAIKNCNNIIVIEGGKVAEQGNHDNLMKKIGIYATLYKKEK